MNVPPSSSTISNPPSPGPEHGVGSPKAGQTSFPMQQHSTAVFALPTQEQVHGVTLTFPGLESENTTGHADPATPAAPHDRSPRPLSRPRRSIEAMPPEVMQEILRHVDDPQASPEDRRQAFKNMAYSNRTLNNNINDQRGPVFKQRVKLLDLPKLRARLPVEGGSVLDAVRLKQFDPSLTAVSASFVLRGKSDPELTAQLSRHLEFQPTEMKKKIEDIGEATKRGQGEWTRHYELRLKQTYPELTREEVVLATHGEADPDRIKELAGYLIFMPSEEQARIDDLRGQYPPLHGEDPLAHQERLEQDYPGLPKRDISLLTLGME